ncbi:hypothetical protein L7F22_001406 [Adiantum nelumboides]|nr:hypothetical protein [Adiantum nelumboides]
MAGARQLLRKVLRERRASLSSSSHLFCPVAYLSRGHYQPETLQPCNQRALNFHSVADDEENGFSPQGVRFLPSSDVNSSFINSSEVSGLSKYLPRTFSGDSCRSSTTSRVGISAFGRLFVIRAVGTPKNICYNGYGPSLSGRYCSTVTGTQLEGELGGPGKVDGLDVTTADVAGKLASPEAQALNEVSAIIGDCSYPTAFVQILMDNMHTALGLPWWAAIAATTICIRLLCLPIVAYQMKSAAKLSLMRPKLEKINERIKASNYDPNVSSEGRNQIFALFKEYKTTPLSPFLGAVLQAPVFLSFFFAVTDIQ